MWKLIFNRCYDFSARAWLLFVQWINAIAMSLLGGALIVHQSYPTIFSDLLGPIPTPTKAAILFAFGTIVHFALRQAKKVAIKPDKEV